MWRDFPEKVVAKTGCPAVVYSRSGCGNSQALGEPRKLRYLHDEACLVLPELLEKLSISSPVFLGHSDGGSIALIYAGTHDDAKGLVLLAPHVFVEELSLRNITAVRRQFETTAMLEKLGRYHKDPSSTFWGWNNIWLHPDFRSWNIEEFLPRITCPVLAIQGLDDQYGTLAQLEAIESQIPVPVERLHLANCRHSPHRDQPAQVLEAVGNFVSKMAETPSVSRSPAAGIV